MWRGVLVGLGCMLLLLGGCGAGVEPTSTTVVAPPSGGASASGTIGVGGRPVSVYVPASLPPSPTALVVALHGYGGDAAGAVAFFGLRPLADQRGFVVAAPQGTVDRDGKAFWNSSRSCCNFWDSAVDDSDHLSRVIATVVAEQAIDPNRVYVVGHSNGGFMAHRFACTHPGQVAAIASLAGALDSDGACIPTAPVSVLQVHGDADETILYDGGSINGEPYTSAVKTVSWWRRTDGCTGKGQLGARLDADAQLPGDDLQMTTWTGCRNGSEVALWAIAEGSHAPALTPAFTAALFGWFEAHRRTG